MDRILACSLVVVLGCSDDGAPAVGTGGGTGTLSEGSAAEGGTNGNSTRGTSGDEATASDTAGPGSGDATTGAGTSGMTCEQDEDCGLVNDCCSCMPVHVDDTPPMCNLPECDQATCSAIGLPEVDVRCRFGTCEFVPVACSQFLVACDENPPPCSDDTLPSVVDGCWGPCVPAEACDTVPSCDDCPDDEACIESSTQLGYSFTCEPIDPACSGTPDCTCMGTACEDPFVCAPAGDANGADLACECPTC